MKGFGAKKSALNWLDEVALQAISGEWKCADIAQFYFHWYAFVRELVPKPPLSSLAENSDLQIDCAIAAAFDRHLRDDGKGSA